MLNKSDKINHEKEENLWLKFLSGNDKVFDQIYEYWFPKLMTYGLQITTDQYLVQDTVQQIFIEFWQKRKKLKKIEKFKNYLFKSFRNKLIKQLSTERNDVPLNISAHENYDQLVEAPFESFLIQHQIDQHLQQKIKAAYQQLTPRQKEAVYFRFYENMSYLEISNTMDFKDAKYARTLIYRAIEKLRIALRNVTVV